MLKRIKRTDCDYVCEGQKALGLRVTNFRCRRCSGEESFDTFCLFAEWVRSNDRTLQRLLCWINVALNPLEPTSRRGRDNKQRH